MSEVLIEAVVLCFGLGVFMLFIFIGMGIAFNMDKIINHVLGEQE